MNNADQTTGMILIGAAYLFGIFSIAGLILFQAYTFLSEGMWHWYTVAELLYLAGYEPMTILDPLAQWEWVGIGKIVNWTFYTASAGVVVIAISIVVGLIGMVFMSEQH